MRLAVSLLLLLFSLLIGCRNSTEPRAGHWVPVAQLPNDGSYTKISFTNQQNGWVVGRSGRTLHTTNGGYNWQTLQIGTTRDLHALSFVDDQTGWVAGQSNTIVRTTDGGHSWQLQSLASDTTHRLLAISFVDSQYGWVVSNYGEIFHTTDGGTSWSGQQSGTQWGLTAVHFIDNSIGWACATNQIGLRTVDAGLNWETMNLFPSSSPGLCTDIKFIDEHRGWIATTVLASSSIQTGSPLLFTEDGGTTWSQQALLPSMILTSIEVVYPSFAWVAGDNRIFSTQDGGKTWASQYESDGEVYMSISFTDIAHGWALSSRGIVLRYELQALAVPSQP